MLSKLRNMQGFTLVELMIVVAIIGILASIAIPNFLRFRMNAKTSEAKSNLGAIRSTEIAYYAEWDRYVGNQTSIPTGNRSGKKGKETWPPNNRFTVLGFAPEGKVYYDYNLEGADWSTISFTSRAQGDLDADSNVSVYTIGNMTTELLHAGARF